MGEKMKSIQQRENNQSVNTSSQQYSQPGVYTRVEVCISSQQYSQSGVYTRVEVWGEKVIRHTVPETLQPLCQRPCSHCSADCSFVLHFRLTAGRQTGYGRTALALVPLPVTS